MEKEIKYLCGKCEKELKQISFGGFDAFSFLLPKTFYCENKKCNNFGLITVGVIEN